MNRIIWPTTLGLSLLVASPMLFASSMCQFKLYPLERNGNTLYKKVKSATECEAHKNPLYVDNRFVYVNNERSRPMMRYFYYENKDRLGYQIFKTGEGHCAIRLQNKDGEFSGKTYKVSQVFRHKFKHDCREFSELGGVLHYKGQNYLFLKEDS